MKNAQLILEEERNKVLRNSSPLASIFRVPVLKSRLLYYDTNYNINSLCIHKIMEIKWLEVRPGKIRSTMKERGRSQVTEGLGRARGATEHLAERIRIRAALGSSPRSP